MIVDHKLNEIESAQGLDIGYIVDHSKVRIWGALLTITGA